MKSHGATGNDGSAETAVSEPARDITVDVGVEDFLNSAAAPGLDDHPELEFNPIFMYNLKKFKDREREDRRRQQLIAEGFEGDELEQMLKEGLTAGGGDIVQRNALATLIAAGARFQPIKSAQNIEDLGREERRRQLRNVDGYLMKQLDADTRRVVVQAPRGRRLSKGTVVEARAMSALERAHQTAHVRVSAKGENIQRATTMLTTAVSARNQLREIQRLRPLKIHLLQRQQNADDDDDGYRQVDPDDVDAIKAELANLDDDVEEADDDDEQLVA